MSFESFVRKADAKAGVYEFALDLSDSTGVYDIYLFTRVDRSASLGMEGRTPQKLNISWISPTNKVWEESVYMDMGDFRGVRQLYRRGIVPEEDGLWTIKIKPDSLPANFRGMGIICDQNGTR